MEIDVGAYIADLLYEHEVVNLPGLGSFTGKYQTANIDHIQGKLQPPSKELAFNTNLVLDDGVLVQYVQQKNLLSIEDAKARVDDFVSEVRNDLNNKKEVVFPKLGRLFRDYEGQLKFIAEGANFNTDSFGLPTVQFFPIRRVANQTEQPPTVAPHQVKVSTETSNDWIQSTVAWFDRNIFYFIGATAIFIIFVIYWFFLQQPLDQQAVVVDPNTPETPTERFNISPSQEEDLAETPSSDQNTDQQNNAGQDNELDTEEPTARPTQKSAVIMIGVFGNQDNVRRLVQKIYEAGFEPYTEKVGKLTRVGVQMAYETESDLQEALRDIQRKFEPKARITKR